MKTGTCFCPLHEGSQHKFIKVIIQRGFLVSEKVGGNFSMIAEIQVKVYL